MIAGLGNECVGIAGRTRADGGEEKLALPFERLRTRNVVHRLLPKPLRRFSPMRPASLLVRFAEKVGADRVLCHFGVVAIEYSEAWEKVELPLFVHFHGFDFTFDLREQDGTGKQVHVADYRDRIVKLSERATFIANSKFCRNCLVEAGVSSERIVVNYLGVEPKPLIGRKNSGRPKILHVGRFVDCKGPDLTIEAFIELRRQGVDAELTMIGEGPMLRKCRALASTSQFRDDIQLPGSEGHSMVQRRLQEATVFTMHSLKGRLSNHEEGFGVAFLDAMSVGLPVVAGRSGGVPEVIEHGVTGFLVEPGDVKGHADYLRQILTNSGLAIKLGEAGWERVNREFTQQRSDEGLCRILKGESTK